VLLQGSSLPLNRMIRSHISERVHNIENEVRATVTKYRIRFLRPDAAMVQASWEFPNGFYPVDGKSLVAAQNMQEKNR